MKPKPFDCVDMKRQGAQRVQKQLEGKTVKQQLEYWASGTKELRKLKEKVLHREEKGEEKGTF